MKSSSEKPKPSVDKILASTLTHLQTLHAFGVGHVMKATRAVTTPENPSPSWNMSPLGKTPSPSGEGKEPTITTLEELQNHIGACTRCPLCAERKTVVFGSGNPHADLLFVGEGPGSDEDEQGLPFVGRAGQLLTKMIEAMKMQRSDVYIANIVKCRPPANRVPEPSEATTCLPFLQKQIALIKPRMIVCLGKTAAQYLLGMEIAITKLRGRFIDYSCNGSTIPVMPTYHPAYLLRNPEMKKYVWDDLQTVMKRLGI